MSTPFKRKFRKRIEAARINRGTPVSDEHVESIIADVVEGMTWNIDQKSVAEAPEAAPAELPLAISTGTQSEPNQAADRPTIANTPEQKKKKAKKRKKSQKSKA